ncbi:MAG: hypothetical protein FRX49_03093 [Trebouxia sp. A1-2]|nr:MAG: hypothetical protein FRX49_03093 [Trebouxia sp. A1-2]
MLYAGNMSTMSEDGLSSDTETLALWGHFQNALEELEQDRSRIGFLDVAVFGAQSSGKSSLLSTLCGLQLPTGTGSAVTRCPIRISVTDNDESFLHMPGRSKEQIPLPQAGTKPCLTEDIYNQALHQLSAGAMTAKELEIRVGRPGHLPLNIVDTPGLIINDVPDRPGTGNDVDINNLRTNLVRGRAFITVFTHVDHLMTDQVNVKDSVDWPEQRYQEFCQAHSEGSQAVYDELLSMCGIPRLLKELQKRQLDHMLSQRHRLLGNLTAVASKLDVTDYPQGEKEVADRLRDVLARITADVKRLHREGLSSLKSRDDQATQVPTNFQANVQAARTLRRFTENAFNDAMKAVMLGWTEEDIKILGNNTLMLNYHTHAWNKTIQGKQAVQSGKLLRNILLLYTTSGLPLVTNDDHAVLACGELLDILQNFIMWRAEIHFRDKHLRMEQFSAFVSEYCKDKATMLRQDFRVLSEELFYTLPSIQASQIYLKPRNEEFQRQLEVAQRRIKLLAFFAVSNLVENLSRRMTYIIFAKTYDVMAQSTWTCAPLTSFDLEAVFRHYFGDTIRHAEWVEPGQMQMQAKHDVVQNLLTALKKFRSPDVVGDLPVYTHAKAQEGPQAGIQQAPSTPSPRGESAYASAADEESLPPQSRPPHTNQFPEQGLQPLTPVQPPAQMHGGQGRQSYDQQPAYYSPHQQQTYQQAGYQQAPPGQGQASYAPQDYPRAQLNMAQDAHGIERSSGSSDSASSSKKTLKGMWKQIVH